MDNRFGETVHIFDRIVTIPQTTDIVFSVLNEIRIERTARSHNHLVAILKSLYQLMFAIMTPPHNHCLARRNTGIDDFVPADHRLSFGSYDISGTVHEIMFQPRFIL